jgi:hypothetical protein
MLAGLCMHDCQVVPFPNPAQSTAKMVAEYTATKLASVRVPA